MRTSIPFLAACLLFRSSAATPIIGNADLQVPLEEVEGERSSTKQDSGPRQLNGRFLHISDIHPDKHYKLHSSTEKDDACHRGAGSAGIYGAETSDCDTPFALVNETFTWIKENLKDKIDFVVWTGDSARHDSDEEIPRTQDEVLSTNRWVVDRFVEVFGSNDDPKSPLEIPIISTFGNNDILPHNILLSGPNKWLKEYTGIWNRFIPEEQRHGFERGGWYYVEVIPRKLAVFSLNTLYFFNNNAAVDGCALRSEPGFEHMEWLRIQLQFMRERGMKAILIGHVPPARTESKQLWDETCWQKYTLWLERYRDVVVGGLYGHMNIDHFMLQDTKEVDLLLLQGLESSKSVPRETLDDELSVRSASDYLVELRENWAELPSLKIKEGLDKEEDEGDGSEESDKKKGKKSKKGKNGKKKKKNLFKKLGGRWGERFQVSLVAPSIVPNYFPTIRVIEYNITGLDKNAIWTPATSLSHTAEQVDWLAESFTPHPEQTDDDTDNLDSPQETEIDTTLKSKKKKGGKRHKKKPTNPDLIIPSPPTKGTPPGPAYSPQTLSLLSYTQYYANLTHINNEKYIKPEDESHPSSHDNVSRKDNTENEVEREIEDTEIEDDYRRVGEVGADKWREGKHKGKHAHDKTPHPKKFKFEVEYNTKDDKLFGLRDLTVRSYIELARRIGQYKRKGTEAGFEGAFPGEVIAGEGDEGNGKEIIEVESLKNVEEVEEPPPKGNKKKKNKKKKKHHQKRKNRVWLEFVKRAFVGTVEEEDLESFEQPVELFCAEKFEAGEGEVNFQDREL